MSQSTELAQPRLRLSKSRIQSGRQCHKRLWLEVHQPEAVNWGDLAHARLEEGTRFGELARDLLGGGVLIAAGRTQSGAAAAQTEALLSRPCAEVPMLFEPAFLHEGVGVRVDALRRTSEGDVLIEVKSTTRVKPEHVWDCAIQLWVLRGAGRDVSQVMLGHIDNSFVYTRAGDYHGLLKLSDITEPVEALLQNIPEVVSTLQTVIAGPLPAITTGEHCSVPYGCPFFEHCRATEPAAVEFPVSLLPRAGALATRLAAAGYRDLREVPDSEIKNIRHQRILAATRSDRPFVSPELAGILSRIAYPRYYLDFETITHVIPRRLGTRPFQQLPFQFSCHIEPQPGEIQHADFLDVSGMAPMAGFVERLAQVIGESGPVLVWSKGFEGSRLREMALMFPEHSQWLLAVVERMVDLLPIYRMHYYHREMRGSWSLKSVLPTLAPDLGYDDLQIGDGGAVQDAYRRAIQPDTSADEREFCRRHLLAYCERDTLAMTRLTLPPKFRPTPEELRC